MILPAILSLMPVVEEIKFVCPTELPSGATQAIHLAGSISPEADHPSVNLPSPTVKVIDVGLCIEVGVDGRVASCKASSSSKYFSDLSCKLVKRRFRYTPAIDQKSQLITSFVTNKVRWKSIVIAVNRDGE